MKRLFISILLLFVAFASASADDFNIKKYGAVSDTTKYSTKAIQRAIDACSKAGGGRVLIPAGNYKIGSILLKNNVVYGFSTTDNYCLGQVTDIRYHQGLTLSRIDGKSAIYGCRGADGCTLDNNCCADNR
jgi:hypothetical protein